MNASAAAFLKNEEKANKLMTRVKEIAAEQGWDGEIGLSGYLAIIEKRVWELMKIIKEGRSTDETRIEYDLMMRASHELRKLDVAPCRVGSDEMYANDEELDALGIEEAEENDPDVMRVPDARPEPEEVADIGDNDFEDSVTFQIKIDMMADTVVLVHQLAKLHLVKQIADEVFEEDKLCEEDRQDDNQRRFAVEVGVCSEFSDFLDRLISADISGTIIAQSEHDRLVVRREIKNFEAQNGMLVGAIATRFPAALI